MVNKASVLFAIDAVANSSNACGYPFNTGGLMKWPCWLTVLVEVVVTFLTSGIVQDKYKGYTLPIAVAIVLSGQYEDDVDNSDEIVYTGQGGNDLLGNKRQIKDQVMHLGNLALKVCHLDYVLTLL